MQKDNLVACPAAITYLSLTLYLLTFCIELCPSITAQDIKLMQSLGIKNFRLSISWPRIFPQGRGLPNPEGLKFYSDLIDALLAAGIEPHVTLYHWDLPQTLMVSTHNS